eukprot:681443-Prymnesium_polylepis.1
MGQASGNVSTEPVEEEDAVSEHSQLLGDGARPALLGTEKLSKDQQRLDERIRTLCLVVMALAADQICAPPARRRRSASDPRPLRARARAQVPSDAADRPAQLLGPAAAERMLRRLPPQAAARSRDPRRARPRRVLPRRPRRGGGTIDRRVRDACGL